MENSFNNKINYVSKINGCSWNLHGIVKEHVQNSFLMSHDYQNKKINTESFILDGHIYSEVQSVAHQNSVSLDSIINVIWHTVLGLFTNGDKTNTLGFGFKNHHNNHSNIFSFFNHDSKFEEHVSLLNLAKLLEGQSKNMELFGENDGEDKPLLNSIMFFRNEDENFEELLKICPLIFCKNENINSHLSLYVYFDADLLRGEVIRSMIAVVGTILESLAKKPEINISELPLITAEQAQQINLWQGVDGDFPSHKMLHNLFEDASDNSPEETAIVYKASTMPYRSLNETANQLARALNIPTEQQVKGEIIAVFLDTSELTIISVLGIWKSGAAFVMIDSSLPEQRISFILNDAKVKRIVTNSHYSESLKQYKNEDNNLEILEIESLIATFKNAPDTHKDNLKLNLIGDSPAYMTYTSGTTGVPKGVLKSHKSVVNSITDLVEQYAIGKKGNESIVLFSPCVFEPFVRQLLIALITSQRLVLIDDSEKMDLEKFPAFINRHKITYLHGTASVLQQYDLSNCPSLLRLVLVGEELTPARYNQLRKTFQGPIIGEYSFTESAFVTSIKVFEFGSLRTNKSIGRPLRNVKWYVLNEHLKQMPIGTIGELYIGGVGLASGYWNRDELTKQRFLKNPYQSENERTINRNGYIYKTGDLARLLPNGEIEYLGRNDFQLKLNGVRIEPAEIETVASLLPGVTQCVVHIKETFVSESKQSSKYLVGYFTSNSDVSEDELISFLGEHLPRYMLPARMIKIDYVPITINGKVDFKALPDIELEITKKKIFYRNSIDELVCEVCSYVLGVEKETINIEDHFFRLGGDSITCIQFISKIKHQLNVELSIENIFSLQSLEKVSDHLSSQTSNPIGTDEIWGEAIDNNGSIIVYQDEENSIYLANGLQQGLMYQYFKQSNCVGDSAYIMQSIFHYNTEMDAEKFKESWEHIQRKYSALRLRFLWKSEPIQMIVNSQLLDWEYIDLTNIPDAHQQEAEINLIQQSDRTKPYNLEKDNLFRVYLIKQSENLYTSIFSCHHIILDGWSIPILIEELHSSYAILVEGNSIAESDGDTYEKTQKYIQSHREDHIEYWSGQIDQITERGDYSGLIKDDLRYKVLLREYDNIQHQKSKSIWLNPECTKKIRKICTSNGITLHSVLQFLWHKTLNCIGGGAQTVVGTVVSGRNVPVGDIEKTVGLLINTLPLIVDHREFAEKSVLDAIKDIQAKVFAMSSRSNVELGRLQKGVMKHALFDSLFVLENHPDIESRSTSGVNFSARYELEKLDYPLAVIVTDNPGLGIGYTICFASELFDDDTIGSLLELISVIYEQISNNILSPLKDLEFLSQDQALRFENWNKTSAEFPISATLHQQFENVVVNAEEKIAVVYEDKQLTYTALNAQSNQIAYYLRSVADIQPNNLIILLLDKSELMIASILGVWKSGAAYVPVDPSYPEDRINYILNDTNSKIIITNKLHSENLRRLNIDGLLILCVEDLPLDNLPTGNTASVSCATDLAYVIYTSGTTGRPKGVMVEHIGVVNLQCSLSELFSLKNQDESFLSFSNYVFDHFVEQMTDALLNGQKLVVLNDEMRSDKKRLYRYINDNNVTYLSGTPSVLSLYEYDGLPTLTRIDAIGEDFSEPLFNKIRSTFKGQIINGYGPTEVSITSHKRPYNFAEKRTNKSIGNLVANLTCYILDKNMKRLPVGAIGELYLGGIGVTRGYLNRPDLSAEKFVYNPFQLDRENGNNKNEKMYKTGDVARWLENGEVEYLGRTDSQVKIRGNRIELAEIESVIASYPGVIQSVVIARDNELLAGDEVKQKYLVGFYISALVQDEDEIVEYLYSKLPEYMVPNQIIKIDHLPVTVSGKLNVSELPKTVFSENKMAYAAPRNGIELNLCSIWSELLGISAEKIGINDNFFSLGGDSIMVIKLAYMITKEFGQNKGVAGIFNFNTIALQGAWLSEVEKNVIEFDLSAGQSSEMGVVSLSQERLLFIDKFEGGTNAYNITINMQLPDDLSEDILNKSVMAMLARHSVFRTLIAKESQEANFQKVIGLKEAVEIFKVEKTIVHTKMELDEHLIRASEYVFSLENELPIRINLISFKSSYYLSVVVHHICFDGWSWKIFKNELKAFYDHYQNPSLPIYLPELKTEYIQYSRHQRALLHGEKMEKLKDYWVAKLAGFEPLNLLPDYQRPAQFNYSGQEVTFLLDIKTTEKLKAKARVLKVSFYSLLTSAYCLMLSQYANQQDIVIGFPVVNRDTAELQNIIGFFANILALRVNVKPDLSLTDYIQSVSRETINAQIHQSMPFEKLVKLLSVENDYSRHPIFQVIFAVDLLEAESESNALNHTLTMNRYTPDSDGSTVTKYDLSAWISESSLGLQCNFTYATGIFSKQTVAGFLETFIHLLTTLAEFESLSTTKINQLSYVNDDNYLELIETGAEKFHSCQNDQATLIEHFDRQVLKKPNEIALIYRDTQLTYKELNDKANQLASSILSKTAIAPDDLISLLLNKNEFLIISILAVWKTGAAYVPIDPRSPKERIDFIVNDTKSKIIISNVDYAHDNCLILNLADTDYSNDLADDTPRHPKQKNSNLAYVIYTSGTTGKPKGVLVEHKTVVNLLNDLRNRYFDGEENESILLLANYVFDFSVEQIIISVLSGNKLIIYCDEHSSDEFYAYANKNKLSYMSGTPTHIMQFDLSKIHHLKKLVVAGEAFTHGHYQKIRKEFDGVLINAYGVTEATVYNTVKIFQKDDAYSPGLGVPLSNMKTLVLNKDMQLLPTGAIGELYLVGDCVARGYLNRADLTQERFIRNPFQTENERRSNKYATLYKTGDLVRYLPDGELVYLGRNDFQVKIRGMRIELGEIESVLSGVAGVKQCAVIVTDSHASSEERNIVGYYVSDDLLITEALLCVYLKDRLPSYLVPKRLIRIENQLPMTVNGKIDIKALPIVDIVIRNPSYTPPRTKHEEALCRIWAELLKVDNIGIDHDFFMSGGDSIIAMAASVKMEKNLKIKIRVKDIFDYPTIRGLSEHVVSDSDVPLEPAPMSHPVGGVEMLPIQDWFFAKQLKSPNYWNQTFGIKTPELDFSKLQSAAMKLVEHHDSFRLRYKKFENRSQQYYATLDNNLNIQRLDVSALTNDQISDALVNLQKSLDIENGPTFRIAYLHGFPDSKAVIWFAMHHLIVDTVSWFILLQDLQRLYSGGQLGFKSTSYQQWSDAIRNYAFASGEREYWENFVKDLNAAGTLPLTITKDQYKQRISLDRINTNLLLTDAHLVYNTRINELLLPALGVALTELTGNSANYIALEGHGREEVDLNLNVAGTVGWFTSMYPFLIESSGNLDTDINSARQRMRGLPRNGLGYGALYGYTNNSLPIVSFNYLGRFNESSLAGEQWVLAGEYCGFSCADDDKSANAVAIDITGFVDNGCISFDISSRIDQAKAKTFGDTFKSALLQIIDHVNSINKKSSHNLNEESEDLKFDPYVMFNQELTDRPILFMLPPGEGGAESYFNNLVKHFPEFRLVVFNNYYLDNPESEFSFEQLAGYYLQFIREFQESGPYHFLGWSFGGVLALEISRQLAIAGEKIAYLHFIDSYFNVRKASFDIGLPDEKCIIDRINYIYEPDNRTMQILLDATDKIVLFKAMHANDSYRTDNQRKLYDYYKNSSSNNLETLVDRDRFQLVEMVEDTHGSWVNNQKLLASMAFFASASIFGKASESVATTDSEIFASLGRLGLGDSIHWQERRPADSIFSLHNTFPLTAAQKNIYFDQLFHGNCALYNIGGYIKFKNISVDGLTKAHEKLIKANDIFGVRIISQAGRVEQYISQERTVALPVIDFRENDPSIWLDKLFQCPIDIENGELFKAFLLKVSDDEYYYVGLAHHVIMDGWGFSNWAEYVSKYYE